jgi:TRAP-type C4-dicarboxylate transport system permease small subunit
MKKISIVINKAANIVAIISIAGTAALMLLNVADVVMTKLFARSIQGAYEISESLLLCAVFASFAYGQTQKTHVHMTLFVSKLPGRFKMIPYTLGCLISTAIAGALTYATFFRASRVQASHAETITLHIPVYPFYYLSAVCLVLFTITILYDTVLSVIALFRDDYAELVSKNW